MNRDNGDPIPADLVEVAELLREHRPAATELELDEVKHAVKRRTASAKSGIATRTKGVLMRSRIALATVLVLGIILSSTGVTLAVSGLSSDDSASQAQYRPPADGDGDGIGDQVEDGPTAFAEPTEQVAVQGDGELPVTGFLAIPLVIGGVALLTTGLVIRRKTRG
jgi:hypothetical protein